MAEAETRTAVNIGDVLEQIKRDLQQVGQEIDAAQADLQVKKARKQQLQADRDDILAFLAFKGA